MELDKVIETTIDDFEVLKDDIDDLEKVYKSMANKVLLNDGEYDESIKYIEKCKEINLFKSKVEDLFAEYNSILKENIEGLFDNSEDIEFVDYDNFSFTDPIQIKLLGEVIDVKKNWRNTLVTVVEHMILKNSEVVKKFNENPEFQGRKRKYFSYDIKDVRDGHKLSNGLYVEMNLSANSIATLCKRIVQECGYKSKDIKFKVEEKKEVNKKETTTILKDNEIKLPKKYASLHITKELFKYIVSEIIEYEVKFNSGVIETSKLKESLKDIISEKSVYSVPYHVIINIVSYLKDFQLVNNYPGTKKGKYILKDKEALRSWLNSAMV